MPGKMKRYSLEFKEQAARQVADKSRPITQVARTSPNLGQIPNRTALINHRLVSDCRFSVDLETFGFDTVPRWRSAAGVARVVLGDALVAVPVLAGPAGHDLLRVALLDLG